MKTKSMFFSLVSMAICGSAFAISVDDRQSFCEQHSDKYVWVEKTEACIPVNPCESDSTEIKQAYCVDEIPLDNDTVFRAYISNTLNTYAMIPKDIVSSSGMNVKTYTLTDGGYIAFNRNNVNVKGDTKKQQAFYAAFWTYGLDLSPDDFIPDGIRYYMGNDESGKLCDRIESLATNIYGSGGRLIFSDYQKADPVKDGKDGYFCFIKFY